MTWTAEDYLAHSAKGTSWQKKDHKYIKKEGNRYYYKDAMGTEQEASSRKEAERGIEEKPDGNLGVHHVSMVYNGKQSPSSAGDYTNEEGYDKLAKAYYKNLNDRVNKKYGAGGMPSSVASLVERSSKIKLKDLANWRRLRNEYAL